MGVAVVMQMVVVNVAIVLITAVMMIRKTVTFRWLETTHKSGGDRESEKV